MKAPTLTPADWRRIRNALRIAANFNGHWWRSANSSADLDVMKKAVRSERDYRETLEKVKGTWK